MKKDKDDDFGDIFDEDETEEPFPSSVDEESDKREAKKEKMKAFGIKTLKIIAVLVAIAFFGNLILSNNQKEKTKETEKQNKEEKISAIETNLIQQYSAINFKEKDFTFSEDLQKESGKNLFLEGNVHDIYQKGGKKFVALSGYDYTGTFEASEEQINFIRNQISKDDLFPPNFLFIVQINTISKLSFKTETDRDGEDVWAYIEPSDDFLLQGKLLDIKLSE